MKSLLYTSLIIFSFACSTQAPEDPGKVSPPKVPKVVGTQDVGEVSFDAKQLANEMESNHVMEIRFPRGSAELPDNAKNKIRETLREARKTGFMEKVKLITWADQEMPTEKGKNLSDDAQALADRRNNSLAKFLLAEERTLEVDPISMAERPQGLKRMFPNETTRIQESLEEAGIPEKGDKKNGLGKASRSIIIFTRK